MTMRAKITNTSRANQGIYTDEGLVHLEAGETRALTIAPDYVDRVKALPFLTVEGDGDKALADHTVAELNAIATAEEIDLGDATKKADIIAAIELAREAGSEA